MVSFILVLLLQPFLWYFILKDSPINDVSFTEHFILDLIGNSNQYVFFFSPRTYRDEFQEISKEVLDLLVHILQLLWKSPMHLPAHTCLYRVLHKCTLHNEILLILASVRLVSIYKIIFPMS